MNSLPSSPEAGRRALLLILAAGFLACGLYIAYSRATESVGFPLDDAWIHQTYARNFAGRGEWAFIPGQTSGGSTSPAWSVLLAGGYLTGGEIPFAWTFLLGALCLAGVALAGQAYFSRWAGEVNWFPWAGLFLAGEWHLVWAATSGMETALMGLMVMLAFWQLSRRPLRWELAGALIGLAVWVRPDGLSLLGPLGLVWLLQQGRWREKALAALRSAGGFAVFFLPYLLFNRLVNGSFWPNTFYAKQAEYAALQSVPFLQRLASELALPLTGPGLLLLPGFCFALWNGWRKRDWVVLAGGIWFLGYAALYAMRLPVVYQHGRYLMPAMPVFYTIGLAGSAQISRALPVSRFAYAFRRAAQLCLGLVWLGFLWIGARAYATDVAIIQTEMVATARWVAVNTSEGDLIAAHDIGALGFFARRKLIDLAGLVTPEVVPFIRDETRLRDYLDDQQVDYLVTFPDWYAHLQDGKAIVYQTGGRFAPEAGVSNMAVYRWK